MTDDRIAGAALSGLGHIEDGVGGLTGDIGLQAKGKVNQVRGSVQNKVGQAKAQADGIISDTGGVLRGALDEAEGLLMERPLVGLSIAAGLGLILGLILTSGHD